MPKATPIPPTRIDRIEDPEDIRIFNDVMQYWRTNKRAPAVMSTLRQFHAEHIAPTKGQPVKETAQQ